MVYCWRTDVPDAVAVAADENEDEDVRGGRVEVRVAGQKSQAAYCSGRDGGIEVLCRRRCTDSKKSDG